MTLARLPLRPLLVACLLPKAVIALTAGLLLTASSVFAQDIPLEDEKGKEQLIGLGPIGARVLTGDLTGDTFTSDSRANAGTVKFIHSGSAAAGKLLLEDKIVGVDGSPFQNDFSRRMAQAIDHAEGGTGTLTLTIERGGRTISVPFTVKRIGSFGSHYPYRCKKSDVILESACDWLARHVDASGRLEEGGYIVNSAVGGLALLGTGNSKYNDITKRLAGTLVRYFSDGSGGENGKDTARVDAFWPGSGLSTWQVTYGAIFLSEYYLATGDASVLPTLQRLNFNIEKRQFHQTPKHVLEARKSTEEVPPYWFGHDVISAVPSYTNLGVNTANAVLGWQLLSECGVAIDRKNFEQTRDFIEIAGPDGDMRYAGVPNQTSRDGESIGRTGVLGVAYALCEDRREHATKIARVLGELEAEHYLHSHASSAMGKAWATLALATLDPKAFRVAMDRYRYDYNLIRLSDGSFAANPKSHFQSKGNPDFSYGRKWTTAFNALIFALPRGHLRITGRHRLIPAGIDLTSVSPSVARLCDTVRSQPTATVAHLKKIIALKKTATAGDLAALEALEANLMKPVNTGLARLESLSRSGDVVQLDSETKLFRTRFGGLDVVKEKTAQYAKDMLREPWATELQAGKKYHAILAGLRRGKGDAGAEQLKEFAERYPDSLYGKWASEMADEFQSTGVIKEPELDSPAGPDQAP